MHFHSENLLLSLIEQTEAFFCWPFSLNISNPSTRKVKPKLKQHPNVSNPLDGSAETPNLSNELLKFWGGGGCTFWIAAWCIEITPYNTAHKMKRFMSFSNQQPLQENPGGGAMENDVFSSFSLTSFTSYLPSFPSPLEETRHTRLFVQTQNKTVVEHRISGSKGTVQRFKKSLCKETHRIIF